LAETRFFTPAGSPARVAADLNGFPWLLNTDGSLWHYVKTAPGKEDWVQSRLKAIDIAVGANGSVWAIDADHHVGRITSDGFESIGGSAVRISVDPSGNPWIVNTAGDVSQWTGTSWKSFAGKANDISVAPDGTVFILGTTPVRGGFEILRLNGTEWQHIVGGGGVAISAGTQAVYVAQDTTTGLVLSSVNTRLRASDATELAQSPVATGTPASQPLTSAAVSPTTTNSVATAITSSQSVATAPQSTTAAVSPAPENNAVVNSNGNNGKNEQGGSVPGKVVGAVGSGAGFLGGLLAKIAPAAAGAAVTAAGAANPVPSPQAIAGAVAAGAAGAAGGAAVGAAGNLASSIGSGGSGPSAGSQPQSQKSAPSQAQADKLASADKSLLNSLPPLQKIPLPGKLTCPIIGSGETMEKLCEIGRSALKLRLAPSMDCAAPAFIDSRNGGECWTCPATFARTTTPVDSAAACINPATQSFSVATLVSGCSAYKAPPGYGTPFRDTQAGNNCYVCPLPFKWSIATLGHLTKGDLAACVGKGKDLLVWQLGQYPETGAYRFMPGLLSIALSDPKAVDAFLTIRANGDSLLKREMWAKMIADPSSSAELKALLFASLLKVASQDSASALAKQTLGEFETYMRSRRFYVAQEAFRMYRKAREVDSLYVKLAKDSGGVRGALTDAAGTAITDFKTDAWSGVMPDSAGTAFVLASAALSKLGAPNGVDSVITTKVSALNASYLAPVTDALAQDIDMLQEKRDSVKATAATVTGAINQLKSLKGADPALIGSTLLGGAMKISGGVLGFLGKNQLASEYEAYLQRMSAPLKVKDMLESTVGEEKQTLMLYWALATSPHKAADTIGGGAMTGAELCNSDAWTAAQCSSARELVAAAAKAAGYIEEHQ
jgi:hypothetical protein